MVAVEEPTPLRGRGGGLCPPGWVFAEAHNPPQRLRRLPLPGGDSSPSSLVVSGRPCAIFGPSPFLMCKISFLQLSPFSKADAASFEAGGHGTARPPLGLPFMRFARGRVCDFPLDLPLCASQGETIASWHRASNTLTTPTFRCSSRDAVAAECRRHR